MTLRDYARYMLATRIIRPSGSAKLTVNMPYSYGRLCHQYIVDMWARVQQNDLNFIRMNQRKLRASLYQGLSFAIRN